MKVLSLFSGIGAFEKAINNLGIQYELVGYCEIDKYASMSYSAIHNVPESMNLGDITKVDEKALPKEIDLITYGFPCQDISLAGKQKGLFNEDGSQTRSGLFFDAMRIIDEVQPHVAIAENVKNLTSKKFNAQFQIVLASLDAAGYNNYFKVLNAKNFGIPQNRERVFIVSIRKDIDNGAFQFPEGFPLEIRLKDVLEDDVDDKYYLAKQGICQPIITKGSSGPEIKRIDIPQTVKVRKHPIDCKLLCECLRDYKKLSNFSNKEIAETLDVPITKVEHWFRQDDCFAIPDPDVWMNLKKLLGINTNEFDKAILTFEEKEGVFEKSERHYFADGIAPTLTSTSAGNEKIIEPKVVGGVGEKKSNGGSQWYQQDRIYDGDKVAISVTTGFNPYYTTGKLTMRIRKLTPKECFRLMGFDDESFHKAETVNSNTQLYKQAGNSIVVPVVEYIIKALLDCGALKK